MKKSGKMAQSIDEYLEPLSEKERSVLEKIRKAIRSAAPKSEELISYQIPSFKYHFLLVGFAAFKNHCSFFPMSLSIVKKFKEELKGFDANAGTIRFTIDKPLPGGLIKKMVKERVKENELRLVKRQMKKTSVRKKK
ncbi:MAG: iron chaperone [Cytophagaceae bacterium]